MVAAGLALVLGMRSGEIRALRVRDVLNLVEHEGLAKERLQEIIHVPYFVPAGTPTTNATLYQKLPHDPGKDFTPIALTSKLGFVLVLQPLADIRRHGIE